MEWFMDMLNTFGAWLDDKGFVIVVSGLLGTVAAGFIFYFNRYIIPRVIQLILTWVTKIVSKMFGLPQDDVSDAVQELPIVGQIKDWNERMAMESELKLIELKNKLVSTKLSGSERVAYQAEFDYIMERFGYIISEKTKRVLEMIEDAVEKYELG